MAAFVIPRRPIPPGKEGRFVKFFAPPATNLGFDAGNPAASTIPEPLVPDVTVFRELLLNERLTMWDGRELDFMTIGSPHFPAGRFPAETLRFNQGQIVHGDTQAKGNTHTIHWHGIEPTPVNDGVGHTSFEIGNHVYQFQPNSVGTFFYHCHKNTVLHFEAGLYGMLLVDPPGTDPGALPRRTAAAVRGFPGFDPATFTVRYDVEALWVADDIDPAFLALGHNAGMAGGGLDGPFTADGTLHRYDPRYFFVSGFNVPGILDLGGSVPPGLTVGDLTPGVAGDDAGMQIAVHARAGQNILIRVLNAAYAVTTWTLGLPALIIGVDGRPLGVPPYHRYNAPVRLARGTPFELTTARRYDLLLRAGAPGNFAARVVFRHFEDDRHLFTATIPIVVRP